MLLSHYPISGGGKQFSESMHDVLFTVHVVQVVQDCADEYTLVGQNMLPKTFVFCSRKSSSVDIKR